MAIFKKVKNILNRIGQHLKVSSVSNIIWLIDSTLKYIGLSIKDNKSCFIFWVIYFTLLIYVYFVSCILHQLQYSEGVGDIIKMNVNISVLMLALSIGHWYLTKGSMVKSVIEKVDFSDRLSQETTFLYEEREKVMLKVKWIVYVFYAFNIVNSMILYLPQRLNLSSNFYTSSPCAGLTLTTSSSRHTCRTILFAQDMTLLVVVYNYQTLLLFLIAHTAAMYSLLSKEMLALNQFKENSEGRALISKRLSIIIARHGLLLQIVDHLKYLYNTPIGINFGTNAFCICLFFSLPLQEWVSYFPMLIYCFIVFFLYCHLCQKLINASELFEQSVYCCGWEKFSLTDKKTLFIVLKQAQKPVVLLAAGMVPVNIYTFATALQFMFKFVTVMKF